MTGGAPSARRRAVLGLGAALAAGPLQGCASWWHRDVERVCPESPAVSDPDGPLTIDAHCHVFNGTDLQITAFLSRVALRQQGALGEGARALGSILQGLAWSFAPDGTAELAELRKVADSLASCTPEQAAARVATLRQDAYTVGRLQLQAALRRSALLRPLLERYRADTLPRDLDAAGRIDFDAIRIIETLPESVESYRAPLLPATPGYLPREPRTAAARAHGMIDFVLQNFQYRYVSVHDYLRTYNQPGTRVVDLMLPSMLDYDWWLVQGDATPTSLATQVEVMEQIAVVTGGRVHAFVPYDPLREVAYELGFAADDSFGRVRAAIEERGCCGVKLYPPMGFAPLGNEQVQREAGTAFWARPWLPAWTRRPDMGALLDRAMARLLAWCEANEVPVMAHTSLSNGAAPDFEALAGAAYWRIALQAFGKLRVSFGHFGDSSIVADGLDHARAFAALMKATGPSGQFAYADAGYFVEVVASEPALLDNLRALYDETAGKGDAALANRFLYGTDWEMTLAEGSVTGYLTQFVRLFDQLEARPAIRAQGLNGLSRKFFGANAVDFIGLHRGGAARRRLEAFHAARRVPVPDWMSKIDRTDA